MEYSLKLTCRRLRFFWQKLTRGFDDTETWCLGTTTARFIAPRLRRYREINMSYPAGMESSEWEEILDEIQFAVDTVAKDQRWLWTEETHSRVESGLRLFGDHFLELWS